MIDNYDTKKYPHCVFRYLHSLSLCHSFASQSLKHTKILTDDVCLTLPSVFRSPSAKNTPNKHAKLFICASLKKTSNIVSSSQSTKKQIKSRKEVALCVQFQ